MSQILENKTSNNPSLKEVILYFWRLQEGFAIIWIIGLIMAFATVGSVIVATYHVSLFGQLDASLSSRAESLAESGYRFLYSEYKSQSNDEDKNKLLEELHSKTFNISPDGKGGQFELNMTSYFYRVETVTNGSQLLKVKFIGDPGFTVPATGYLRNIEDATLYEYGDKSHNSVTDVYTFTLSGGQTVSSTNLYTTVIPAAKITNIVVDADGTRTLTLDSGQGELFPPEKGMFLITKEKIKAHLPVMQIVPYKYEYRDGDQLFKVDKGPGVGDFHFSISDMAEVAKFVSLKSTGYVPDKANYIASEINDFNVSLDISASSTWHSSTGLKSYWSFDDAGTPGKDDYGTSAGTLTGGVTTATGKVGGALEFDTTKTGYVTTTFNPSLGIGSNAEFTVVFWAKPGSDITTEQGIIGVSKTDQNFYIGIIEGYWEWGLGTQNDSDPGDGSTGLPKAIAEQWQHVAFVYDRSDVILYINGIKKYSEAHSGPFVMPSYNVYLGALYDPNTGSNIHGFTGSLDEIAIFNTALSICEIREIYDVPCNVGCGVFNTANDPGVDPVAYYPFNGNTNDESGPAKDGDPPYDNPATVVNQAFLTTDRFGCEEKAYGFDGANDYLQAPHSDSLEMSGVDGQVTVAAWVKQEPAQTGFKAIVQKSDNSYTLRLRDGYEPVFRLKAIGAGTVEARAGLDDLLDSPGEWYFLVGTYDGTDVKIYIDGQEAATVPAGGTGIDSATTFDVGIGKNLDKDGRCFDGSIDDISIWDQALTSDQVLDYYKQTSHK
jgi:hypothetical protein